MVRLKPDTTIMVRLKPDTTIMVRLKPDTTMMVRLKPDTTIGASEAARPCERGGCPSLHDEFLAGFDVTFLPRPPQAGCCVARNRQSADR